MLPTITGTVSGQPTISEAPVRPFAHTTIGDANVGATDTLTITLGGVGGTLTDGTGFTSLTTVSARVYRLSGTAAAITSELDALIFTPTAGAPNTTSTTTFTLSDQSSANGVPVIDAFTSVIDTRPPAASHQQHPVAEHQRPGLDLEHEREHLGRRRGRDAPIPGRVGKRSAPAISMTTAIPTSCGRTRAPAKPRSGK